MRTAFPLTVVILLCFIGLSLLYTEAAPSSSSASRKLVSVSSKHSPSAEGDSRFNSYCNAGVPPKNLHFAGKTGSNPSVPSSKLNLRKVVVATRHGQRAPCSVLDHEIVTWNCDVHKVGSFGVAEKGPSSVIVQSSSLGVRPGEKYPYSNLIWNGTCDSGDLTLAGFNQFRSMADALFDRYQTELGIESPNDLYVRATSVPRSQESAAGFISLAVERLQNVTKSSHLRSKTSSHGILQLLSAKKATENTVIPIHVVLSEIDTLTVTGGQCPRQDNERNKLLSSNKFKENVEQGQSVFDTMNSVCGMNSSSWNASYDQFYDNTFARYCHGGEMLPLSCSNGANTSLIPNNTLHHLFERGQEEFRIKYFENRTASEFSKLASAQLINTFMEDFESGLNNYKLFFYSGHDDTIGILFSTLFHSDGTDFFWPSFATNLVLEMWESNSDAKTGVREKSIRALYNGRLMYLRGCAGIEFCPYDRWVSTLRKIGVPKTSDIPTACKIES
eukprot:Nk52_evm2s320 gene=Nk52_evmTU2s320